MSRWALSGWPGGLHFRLPHRALWAGLDASVAARGDGVVDVEKPVQVRPPPALAPCRPFVLAAIAAAFAGQPARPAQAGIVVRARPAAAVKPEVGQRLDDAGMSVDHCRVPGRRGVRTDVALLAREHPRRDGQHTSRCVGDRVQVPWRRSVGVKHFRSPFGEGRPAASTGARSAAERRDRARSRCSVAIRAGMPPPLFPIPRTGRGRRHRQE